MATKQFKIMDYGYWPPYPLKDTGVIGYGKSCKAALCHYAKNIGFTIPKFHLVNINGHQRRCIATPSGWRYAQLITAKD